MRRTRTWMVCLAPIAASGTLMLAHCSSSSSAPATGSSSGTSASSGGGNANSGSASSGSSSGSSSSSGSGPSSGTGGSGAGDEGGVVTSGSSGVGEGGNTAGEGGASSGSASACVSVDGGAQCSDPGFVPCGNTTCNVNTEFCCVEQTAPDAGRTETCVAPNGACSSNAKISCNEAADCTGGALCCGSFPMQGVQGVTSCMTSCGGPQGVQLCRSDGECGANSDAGELKKCITQTCGSTTLQLCAVPASRFSDAGNGGAYAGCTPL